MSIFKIMSEKDIKKLHSTALDVLDTIGLKVHSEKVRKMLAEAGAKVDNGTMMVRFPSSLIEESIKKAPKKIIYGARNPEHDLVLEQGGDTFCRPVIGAEGYIDLDTGKYRHVQLSDVPEWTRLLDGLENISYCTEVIPPDIPMNSGGDSQILRMVIENTDKHISAYSGDQAPKYFKYKRQRCGNHCKRGDRNKEYS